MKFRESFLIEKEIDKNDFIEKFEKEFEHSELNILTGFFDSLTFKKRETELIGSLTNSSFKLKRNDSMNKFFNQPTATARGIISKNGNKTIIKTYVNGFVYGIIPFYLILLILMLASISSVLFNNGDGISIFLLCLISLIFTSYNMIKDKKKLTMILKKKIEQIK